MLILYSIFREHNDSCKPHETGHTGFGTEIRAKNGKLNGSVETEIFACYCGIIVVYLTVNHPQKGGKDGLHNL